MKNKKIIFFISFLLVSCNAPLPQNKNSKIMVVLEQDSQLYKSNLYSKEIETGENIEFIITVKNDGWIENCSYSNYEIIPLENNNFLLLLKDVIYPTYITLNIETEKITYNGNGGLTKNGEENLFYKMSKKHLRENVENKMDLFFKDGYVSTGFNLKEDGSAEHIGYGSRIPYDTNEIFCEWEKETPIEDFLYHKIDNQYVLDSYIGNELKVVIPESKGTIFLSDNLFNNKKLDTLVISNNVKYLGKNTFDGLSINELYICDNNPDIPGESLDKCNIKKVHINASVSPSYSGSYYDLFQDKMDYLYKIKDKKKFVLFGGSSVRYGYNSELIIEQFPSYDIVNMGVYAYYNALPQFEIISNFMNKEDYMIHSPEFDNHAVSSQFCLTNDFDSTLFAAFESNYEMLSMLDLSNYPSFFSSFEEFLKGRLDMEHRDYSFQAIHYDDESVYYNEALYNIYGDMTMYREGHDIPNVKIYQDYVDHTLENITPHAIECLNNVYDKLKEKDINILFTYYPKNRYCLSSASTLEKRNELEKYINQNLHVKVISNMEDYLFDANYFYKIDNHLSSEGADIRTKKIINDLKRNNIK